MQAAAPDSERPNAADLIRLEVIEHLTLHQPSYPRPINGPATAPESAASIGALSRFGGSSFAAEQNALVRLEVR